MSGHNLNENLFSDKIGTQSRRRNFGRYKKRCSSATLYYNQCPNFSKFSQTHLSFFLQFSQMTKKNWLHLSLTTVRCFWTIIPSWKLLVIYSVISVASFKGPNSGTLTGKDTYCTTFNACEACRSGSKLYVSGFLSRALFNLFKKQSTMWSLHGFLAECWSFQSEDGCPLCYTQCPLSIQITEKTIMFHHADHYEKIISS